MTENSYIVDFNTDKFNIFANVYHGIFPEEYECGYVAIECRDEENKRVVLTFNTTESVDMVIHVLTKLKDKMLFTTDDRDCEMDDWVEC